MTDNIRVPQSEKSAPRSDINIPFGWRRELTLPSLPEVHRTIPVFTNASPLKKIFTFAGPGYLIAVGYMDPGNWATGISAGSRFGYALLSVVLLSTLFAIFLQALSAKLGIATGRDLAQACRDHYPPFISVILWLICELAIAACDLAEVLGCAVALKLLFNLPIIWGVILTILDVFLVLAVQNFGFRFIEAFVITLIITIAACFAYEIFLAQPLWKEAVSGFIPTMDMFTHREMLYAAIGLLGATIMPHNLYLHSSIVHTRAFAKDNSGKKEALRYALIDSTIALCFTFFINAAIVILGAAVFHHHGLREIADLSDAYQLLSPILGTSLASTLFAFALLASGQNSSLTGTLAGQIVMEGYLNIRIKPWQRRLLTRAIAIIPAILVIGIYGENKVLALLILSQVILSFQLPFAMIPLIQFTSERAKMGALVNSKFTKCIAYIISIIIIALNGELIWLTFF